MLLKKITENIEDEEHVINKMLHKMCEWSKSNESAQSKEQSFLYIII